MKPLNVFRLILLTIGSAAWNQSPPGAEDNSGGASQLDRNAQDVAALKKVEDQFISAFRAKDADAIMRLCVPDDTLVVFDVHPPRQYKGPQAYRKDWEELFRRFSGPLQAEISEVDAAAGGDVGYIHSVHRMIGTTTGGKKVDYTVRVTDGFKKVNGRWLIAHTHVSFPVDPATGRADMQSKP